MAKKVPTAEQREALQDLRKGLESLLKEVKTLTDAKETTAIDFARFKRDAAIAEARLEKASAAVEGGGSELEKKLEAIEKAVAKIEGSWNEGIRNFTAGADLLLGRVVASQLGQAAPMAWVPAGPGGPGGTDPWRCPTGGPAPGTDPWRCPGGSTPPRCY